MLARRSRSEGGESRERRKDLNFMPGLEGDSRVSDPDVKPREAGVDKTTAPTDHELEDAFLDGKRYSVAKLYRFAETIPTENVTLEQFREVVSEDNDTLKWSGLSRQYLWINPPDKM